MSKITHIVIHILDFGDDILLLLLQRDVKSAISTPVDDILFESIVFIILLMDNYFCGEFSSLLFAVHEHSFDIVIVERNFLQRRLCIVIHLFNMAFDVCVGLRMVLDARARVVQHAADLG